jgi:topoisomerase-4 subunit A
LNGSTGIAVGMAADLPSHNVKEVADATIAYIKDNDITVEGILEHLKGPDLPTGGQIVDSKEHILNCYATGKGNLHVRARWEIETLSHGQWRAVITELPQDMSPKDVLELVANASVYEVPKGEKPNQRMLDLKQYIKINIDDIKDITSKDDPDGSARMLIEPKSSRNTDPDEFMLGVVSMLGLQSTLKFNLTTVSTDLFPRQRNIKEIITDWVEFRRRTITLRTETRLAKIIDRLELVRGRLSIMDLIDEVIEIIRTDDEPQQALMQRFSLTERQANDILEIKLRELRKLEEYKLQEENDKLEKEKSGLDALLASKVKMNNLITREINTATEKMADERRTLIKEEKTSATVIKNIVPADPITLWFTKDNWLVGRKSHIPDNESPTSSLKPGDNFSHHIQAKLTDNLIVLGKSGRIYNIAASAASFGRGSGIHLSTLINLNGDSVQWVGVYEEGMKLLLSHSEGYGFVIEHQNLVTKQKAGKECFKLSKYPSASIADVIRVREETPMVNIWTNKSRFIQFNINEINDYPKSQGMRLVSLAADETMKGICLSESEVFLCDGVKKRFDNSYLKKRAAAPKKY